MSARRAGTSGDVCNVLVEDPDLAECVPPHRRAHAIDELRAPVLKLKVGPWSTETLDPLHEGIGLLVLRGLLLRRVGVDGRYGAELLGECDILRPWQLGDGHSPLPTVSGWSALAPTRLAVLDAEFARKLGKYPATTGKLVARAVGRTRHLAVNMAIVHQARVDDRLHMMFWHLAGRFGRVRSDGTLLPLRLTHTVLADLVAARRPTVTSALSELTRRGLIQPMDEGWLLVGDPPGDLVDLQAS